MSLPPYCFVAANEIAWVPSALSECSPNESDYVAQCAELESINDKVIVSFKDDKQEDADLEINLQDMHIKYGSVQIQQEKIRYVYVNESKDNGHVLVISYWCDQSILNLHLYNKKSVCIQAMNCIRKLISMKDYSTTEFVRLSRFKPLFCGDVRIQLDPTDEKPYREEDLKNFYITLDEEAVLVYESEQQKEPIHYMYFYCEKVENSIARIYAHPLKRVVEIETEGHKYCIAATEVDAKQNREDQNFSRFSFYIQGRIRPKPKALFNFTGELDKFFRHMTEYPIESYGPDKEQFVPVEVAPISPNAEEPKDLHREVTTELNEVVNEEVAPRRAPEDGNDLSSVMEISKIVQLIHKITNNQDSSVLNDFWVEKEAKLNEIPKDAHPGEYTLESSGLNPDSFDHLSKCLYDIQDSLHNDDLDRASGMMESCENMFIVSRCEELVDWLKKYSRNEKLKQIYLCAD